MNPIKPIPTCAAITIFLLAALACSSPQAADHSDLGSIDFPTSASPEAQEHFITGMLLLHSFEFNDAREAFLEAQKVESDFAMAYWGEALTHNHLLWSRQNLEGAREAMERLGPTPEARIAKAPTEREKDYLRTLDILYGEGEKQERDIAYRDAMLRLAEKYPDDLEAASLAAVATLATSRGGRDYRIYMRAAAIVEEVFAKNPNHPGAAHYLIHSYDDPVHAPLGLRAAHVYAKIAPAATHALHMPSHIFTAMGMWDEVVASNVDSWAASDSRVQRKNLSIDERSYHALKWLEYGYLQQGRYQEAREQLAIMEADTAATGSEKTRSHLVSMRAHYRIETRRWDSESIEVDTSGLGLSATATDIFTRGLTAVRTNQASAAKPLLAELNRVIEEKRKKGKQHKHAADPKEQPPDQRKAHVLARELEAAIHLAEGRADKAVRLLEQATELQETLSLSYGPPDPVKPAHELFGEVLLELKRPQDAAEQFEKALDRAPKRALSLLGLARARSQSGGLDAARQDYADLGQVWHKADSDLPELEEVKQAAEKH